MKETTFNRIKELTELQGTSGFEEDVRAYLKKEMTPLVDDIQQDGLGVFLVLRMLARMHHE